MDRPSGLSCGSPTRTSLARSSSVKRREGAPTAQGVARQIPSSAKRKQVLIGNPPVEEVIIIRVVHPARTEKELSDLPPVPGWMQGQARSGGRIGCLLSDSPLPLDRLV